MHRIVCLLTVLALGAGIGDALAAEPPREFMVTGSVYVESDGRPGRSAEERGVPDVAVSNGRRIVRTDADGRYALPARPFDIVFVVKPDSWRFHTGADGLPRFWFRYEPDALAGLPRDLVGQAGQPAHDIPLHVPSPGPATDTQILVFADPQVKHAADIEHYRRDIVEPIAGRHPARLGVTLGDVVHDDLSLYPALNAVTRRLGTPWFHVPGNHDIDFSADDTGSLAEWRARYGPDTYAVEEGGTSIVLFDDVVYRGDGRYIGGLREDQFAFLAAYLGALPADRRIVLGTHVPLFDTGGRETFRRADRQRLFGLLERFEHVLVLSGHTHTQLHYFHDADDGWQRAEPLHEYSVGAASGAFWSGAKDAAGVPDATMSDGTPNGYALLTLPHAASGFSLAWHPARVVDSGGALTPAMALHAPKVLRRGAYPAFGVYANVFMGTEETRVEFRIDDGEWMPMQRVERPDPRVLLENMRDDLAESLRGYDRSPEARPSTHLWRGTLPTDLAAGEHRVDVRAFDRWTGEQRASTHYRLQDAEP